MINLMRHLTWLMYQSGRYLVPNFGVKLQYFGIFHLICCHISNMKLLVLTSVFDAVSDDRFQFFYWIKLPKTLSSWSTNSRLQTVLRNFFRKNLNMSSKYASNSELNSGYMTPIRARNREIQSMTVFMPFAEGWKSGYKNRHGYKNRYLAIKISGNPWKILDTVIWICIYFRFFFYFRPWISKKGHKTPISQFRFTHSIFEPWKWDKNKWGQ